LDFSLDVFPERFSKGQFLLYEFITIQEKDTHYSGHISAFLLCDVKQYSVCDSTQCAVFPCEQSNT